MHGNLMETFRAFWSFWLGSINETTLDLVAFATSVLFVYMVIIYPLVWIVRGRKGHK